MYDRNTWIRNIPLNWQVAPFGSLFTQRKEKNKNIDTFVLSVVKGKGVIPYSEKGNVGNKVSEDLSGYKKVNKGDFVLNSMNLYMGSVGVSEYDGVTSTAYIVCQPSPDIVPSYYKYIIHCTGFQEYVGLLGKGIMEIREAVRWTSLKSVNIPVPNKETQKEIADFLDRETKKIDKLIDKKKSILRLLKEKSISLKNSVLTKGLHKSGKLLETKFNFLDAIPKNWSLEKLKFSLIYIEQGWSPEAENRIVDENGWGVLKVGCVYDGVFDCYQHKALPPNINPQKKWEVKSGDILMSRGNSLELVGSVGIVKNTLPNLMISDLIFRLRLNLGPVDIQNK
jgi:type I restriction enzyme S subunit